jgi:hypothetical protein
VINPYHLLSSHLIPLVTRVQKQKAAQSEDRADQLAAELLERDAKLEDTRVQLEEFSLRLEKSVKERSQAAAENTALKM